jgi:hypothetical protein
MVISEFRALSGLFSLPVATGAWIGTMTYG